MGYWENLIDVYESWDLESLCEEAYHLSCDVRDDINRKYNVEDPLVAAIMVACYFMDADRFVDGDENSLIRNLFEGSPLHLSGDAFYRSYKRNDWESWAVSYLNGCHGRALEAAIRFGIVVCAADGFIRDEERRRILKWV